MLEHDGVEREYILYVPESYSGTEAVPVVLNFHGFTETDYEHMADRDMRPIADTANFILVYPQGTRLGLFSHWNVGSWTERSTADDLGFVVALLDRLQAEYNVDATRIYACGFSNGGFFSHELACNLSDRIAAIGTVGGNMSTQTESACTPAHPIPVVTIHGTADDVVAYEGDEPEETLSQEEVLAYWADFNNISGDPSITLLTDQDPADGSTVEFYDYGAGDAGAAVHHYRVVDGDHTWPGAEEANKDINAGLVLWEFLSQYDINGLRE